VSREQGRGTFVRGGTAPRVLVVESDRVTREVVLEFVKHTGEAVVDAVGLEDGLATLEREHTISFVLAGVRLPTVAGGTDFIRTIRRRWPELHLAAIISTANDLAKLIQIGECPVLILSKPVNLDRLQLALRLGLRRAA